LFAQTGFLTSRDRTVKSEHDLDQAVKLFLSRSTNAAFDAGCCAWDDKRRVRTRCGPITAIPLPLSPGRRYSSLGAGPGRGAQTIERGSVVPVPADDLPDDGPFAEYASGHSNFQRGRRRGDPEVVHRQRPLRRLRDLFRSAARGFEPRSRSRPRELTVDLGDVLGPRPTQAGSSRRYGRDPLRGKGDLDGPGRRAGPSRGRCWATCAPRTSTGRPPVPSSLDGIPPSDGQHTPGGTRRT